MQTPGSWFACGMSLHQASSYDADTTSRLLTINDVAFRLAISRDSVYRLVRTGGLVPLKVGSRLRFRIADVEEYVARNTAASP
jgi:excisionase family DNA binding protein